MATSAYHRKTGEKFRRRPASKSLTCRLGGQAQGDASARCRRFVRSRQEVTGELFNALHGLERGAQTDAVTPRQTSDRDPTGRRPAVLDVLDLLTEDQVEKGLLCVGEGIEVSLTAAAE